MRAFKSNKTVIIFLMSLPSAPALAAYPYPAFDRSLPNQAGVNYEQLVDTFDLVTTPAYYSRLESEAISFHYTPVENGTPSADGNPDTFVIGGYTDPGLPFFYTIGISSEGSGGSTTVRDGTDATVARTIETTDRNRTLRLQTGTILAGHGLALFAVHTDKTEKTTGSDSTPSSITTASTYTEGAYYDSPTSNELTAGISSGATYGGSFTWGTAIYTTLRGGATEAYDGSTKTVGTITKGKADGQTSYGLNHFARLGLSENSDTGWFFNADYRAGDSFYEQYTGPTLKSRLKNKMTQIRSDGRFFYSVAHPLVGNYKLYLNPEIGYSLNLLSAEHVDDPANTAQAASGGLITADGGKYLYDKSELSAHLALPVIFSAPVTATLIFHSGWYPKVYIYENEVTEEGEEPFSGTADAKLKKNKTKLLRAESGNYGFGFTWHITDQLKLHALASKSTVNSVDKQRVNLTEVSVAADYLFTAPSAEKGDLKRTISEKPEEKTESE